MRALSRNTRRVTALTLAAALVIAVYLNWQYARADITPQTEDDTLMVSAEPVEAEAETAITDALPTEAEAASGVNKNYGEAQLVSVANDSGTRFFEQARLKREKAHDEAMDTLQKSLKSSSLTAEEKKEYTAQMAAGLEDLNAENEIETLVRAKGFADSDFFRSLCNRYQHNIHDADTAYDQRYGGNKGNRHSYHINNRIDNTHV